MAPPVSWWQRVLCDRMDWHRRGDYVGYIGMSDLYTCRRCGRRFKTYYPQQG